jgi:hypothetical protein
MMLLLARLLPVWRWIKANPLLLAIALLALWGLYQRHDAHKWHQRADACQQASQAAQRAQEALRTQERTTYAHQAAEADRRHIDDLASARAATDAFIRQHRVQPQGHSGPAEPIGQASPAPVPADLSTGIVVDERDVRAAAEWQSFGLACRDWALSITGDQP